MNVGTYAFAQLLRALPRTRITRAVGRLCDLRLSPRVSRAVVGAYASAYRVDLAEAEPLAGASYPSFDAFFTRALRAGARPLARGDDTLVSPADGRLDCHGPIEADGSIRVKGQPYRAAELLLSETVAERYRGGQYAVVYLSPRDYHRVHAPLAGKLVAVRSAAGELYPVNAVSERHIPRYLTRNRRVAIDLETRSGMMSVVMVAAMIVGRITVTGVEARDVPIGEHRFDSPVAVARGGELGIFHLGSTAVVLVPPSFPKWNRALGPIRLGQPLYAQASESEASEATGFDWPDTLEASS